MFRKAGMALAVLVVLFDQVGVARAQSRHVVGTPTQTSSLVNSFAFPNGLSATATMTHTIVNGVNCAAGNQPTDTRSVVALSANDGDPADYSPNIPLITRFARFAVFRRNTAACAAAPSTVTMVYAFNQPVRDPRIHTADHDNSSMTYVGAAAGNITRLAGNPNFVVVGDTVNPLVTPGSDCQGGVETGCGTIEVAGTYSSITSNIKGINTTGDGYLVNLTIEQPGIVIRKRTIGGVGNFSFNASNIVLDGNASGTTASVNLATTVENAFVQTPAPPTTPALGGAINDNTLYVVNVTQPTTIQETVPFGWAVTGTCYAAGSPGTAIATIGANGLVTIPGGTLDPARSYVCDFTNTVIPSRITLLKTTTDIPGGPFNFTLTNTVQTTGTVTTSAANTPTQADGDNSAAGLQTFAVANASQNVTINESGLPPGWQLTDATCSFAADPTNTPVGSLSGTTYTIPGTATGPGTNLRCTFTNAPVPSRITLLKTTTGIPGGPFNFTLGNTVQTTGTATTTAANAPTQADGDNSTAGLQPYVVANLSQNVTINESGLPPGWQLTGATCSFAADPTNTPVGSLSGTTYTIPGTATGPGTNLRCTFTNAPVPSRITLLKTTTGLAGGPFNFTLGNTVQTTGAATTTAANTPVQADGDSSAAGLQPYVVANLSQNVTINESGLPPGWQLTGATCSFAADPTNTPVGSLSGTTYTIPGTATGPGTNLRCTFTNEPQPADLQLTKTNTPGINNNIDQVNDTVVSGRSTTYQIRVFNAGPGVATGALVRDTPTTGLDCPAGNPVTITGNGVPAGSFTIGNLTGTGIALGTLANGQTAVLSFTCTVL